MPPSPLGRLIRARRDELGLSQRDVAARTNGAVGYAMVGHVETGFRELTDIGQLRAVAGALEVSVLDLLVAGGWVSAGEVERWRPARPKAVKRRA